MYCRYTNRNFGADSVSPVSVQRLQICNVGLSPVAQSNARYCLHQHHLHGTLLLPDSEPEFLTKFIGLALLVGMTFQRAMEESRANTMLDKLFCLQGTGTGTRRLCYLKFRFVAYRNMCKTFFSYRAQFSRDVQ